MTAKNINLLFIRAASKPNSRPNTFFTLKFILCLVLLRFGLLGGSSLAATFSVSPSTISNTYPGMITLQVTGLTNGESVVVQKFLDANTNGVIDAGDLLVQQFNLTDGANSVIGGVTNINVPGDSNSTTGAITSLITVKNGDFVQSTIGQYSFKVSSPVGRFAPLTNLFRITNFPFAQTITGTVVSSGTNVPNAVVLLLPAPRPGHGPGNPQAATVANNSGSFTLQTPPGTYVPLAFKSNFIANFTTAPVLSLASGQAINTNLVLTTATASISGRLVDAANTSIGLPGIFGPASANGLISVGFTDSNGNFNLRVSSGQWNVGSSDSGLIVHGYVGYQDSTNIDTTGGNVTNLTFHVNKATAMFYGSVKDSLGNPLAGIDVFSQDNYGVFATDGYTDAKGNYVIGVVGDFFGDFWNVQLDTGGGSGNPTNYIFSQSASQQDGGTELAAGQALLQNFTAILATNQITGHVQSGGTNLVGVQVSAYANLGGLDYQAQLETDVGGNYSLNVADGGWNVSVNCYGGDSSLDGLLGSGNYQCPDNQNVNIANGNGTANFSVPLCNDLQITTSSLVDGEVGVGYAAFLNASSCYNPFMWSLVSGSLPPGLQLNSDGEIHGTPSGGGTFSFTIQVMDGVNATTDRVLSLTISQPPHIGLVTQLTGHQLQFQINGRASHLYNIQSSTNLVDWLTVKTYAPTASVFSVVLNIASNEPHRFYRAVLGPGFTDSITQLIGASEGGSISLPGGATVTIPPDFLTNDMTVTIYKLSTFPGEVPDAAISSVGPVLFFSFQAAPDSLSSFHSSGRKTGASSSPINVLLSVPLAAASRLDGAIAAAAIAAAGEVASATGDCFWFSIVLGMTYVSETARRIQIPPAIFSQLQGPVFKAFSFTVGLINSAGTPTQSFPPKRLLWNGNGWTENFNSFDPSKRTLLLVHGLISCVESAYGDTVNNILQEGCYEQAVGFDYNFAQAINVSGAQLAAFLTDLKSRGLTNVDVEAHSEGVPVAISAAVRAPDVPIANMVFLGGAILGSPIANQPSELLSVLWYLGQKERLFGVYCSPYPRLDDALNGPLGPDLSANSPTLQANRIAFINGRAQTKKILVAGDHSLLPDCVSEKLFGGNPNDGVIPGWSALALPALNPIISALNHIELTKDPDVQFKVGSRLRSAIPIIALSANTVTFSDACSDATLTVSNVGPQCSRLNYVISNSLPWLVVNSLSSSLNSGDTLTHSLSVDARYLLPGLNTGTITISDPSATNSPQTVNVSVILAAPLLWVSTTSLAFHTNENASQSLVISNAGPLCTVLDYTLRADATWISIDADFMGQGNQLVHNIVTGGERAVHDIWVNIESLTPGTHTATLFISRLYASDSTVTINVTVPAAEIIAEAPDSYYLVGAIASGGMRAAGYRLVNSSLQNFFTDTNFSNSVDGNGAATIARPLDEANFVSSFATMHSQLSTSRITANGSGSTSLNVIEYNPEHPDDGYVYVWSSAVSRFGTYFTLTHRSRIRITGSLTGTHSPSVSGRETVASGSCFFTFNPNNLNSVFNIATTVSGQITPIAFDTILEAGRYFFGVEAAGYCEAVNGWNSNPPPGSSTSTASFDVVLELVP